MTSQQQRLIAQQDYIDSFKGLTIYGVAGTNGSGKDSLMDFFANRGFLVYNTSDNLRRIASAVLNSTARGGNDSPLGRVGNAQRTAYPGGTVDLGLLDWWIQAGQLPDDLKPRGLVIGSIRGTGEAKRLKEFGGKLIVLDADIKIRYQRLASRRRVDDVGLTFEEFKKHENGDMAVGQTDPTKFGMAAVIEQADIRIDNTGDDLAHFHTHIINTLGLT